MPTRTEVLAGASLLLVSLQGCSSCLEDKRVPESGPSVAPTSTSTVSVFRTAGDGGADGGHRLVHVGLRDRPRLPPPDAEAPPSP